MSGFAGHTALLLRHGLRVEFSSPERLISPLLFAATILVILTFTLGEPEPAMVISWFVAQSYLTGFFALQISVSRAFEPDTPDGAFQLLRTYPVSPAAWFLSRYLRVLLMGSMVLLPTLFLGAFLHSRAGITLIDGPVVLIAVLSLMGLSAIGVLLTTMTLQSGARQILYPVLYFPLTTPVLLAAVESTTAHLGQGVTFGALMGSWLGLLLIFDVVYFTLGLLLFGELIRAT